MKSAMCVHEHHLVNSCTKWGSEQIKETSDRSCCQFVRRALIISVATVLLTGIASSHLLLSDDNDVAVAISSRTNKAYYLGLDSELQDLFRIRGGSDSHSHESWLEETTKPPFARSNMILNRNGRLLFDEGDFAKAWQSRHDVETIFELDGKVGKKSIRVKFRSDSIALSVNKTNVFAYKLWSRVIPDEGTWWINYLDQGNSTEKTLLHIYLVKKRPAMWPRINIPNVQIKPETPCSSENILPIPPPAMEISQDVRGQIRRLQPPQVRIRAKLEDGELARDAPLSVLQVGDEVEVMGSTMGTIIDYDSIRMLYTVDLRDEGEVKLKANRLKRIRTSSQSKNLLSSDTLAAASLKEGASTSERNSSSIIPLHLPSTGAQTGRAAKSFAIPWIPMYSKLKSSSVGSENKLEDLHHKVSLISTQLIGNKTNGEEVVPTAANENQDDVGLKLQFQQDPETLRISERARVHGLFKGLPKVDSRVYHKRFEPEPVKEMGFSERELRILNDDASGRKELLDSYLSQISMGNSLDDHKTKEELTQKFLNHRSEKRTTLNGTYVEEKMESPSIDKSESDSSLFREVRGPGVTFDIPMDPGNSDTDRSKTSEDLDTQHYEESKFAKLSKELSKEMYSRGRNFAYDINRTNL